MFLFGTLLRWGAFYGCYYPIWVADAQDLAYERVRFSYTHQCKKTHTQYFIFHIENIRILPAGA